MNENFFKKVQAVQFGLKATKENKNTFGNYSYRSAEGILQSVKPLLAQEGLTLTISDEVTEIGGRIYVKAVCTLTDGVNTLTSQAYAREAEDKKGMDVAQVTGATSSYARKYALCGMFLLDDNKDADTEHYTLVTELAKVRACTTIEELQAVFHASTAKNSKSFVASVNDQKKKLEAKDKEKQILNDENKISLNGYRENEL